MSDNQPRVQVLYELPGIATIAMVDAAGKNGLNPPFIAAMVSCLEEVRSNPEIRVVLLKGRSDVFCSGASLDTLQAMCRKELKPVDIVLSRMLLNLPVPVVAAMEGHAIGGGLAVGLCADMAVLAEESRYGASFMNMGFTPGMGMTRLLEHYVSPALAHELLYTGRFLKGRHFIGKSQFNYILPKPQVLEQATLLAQAMAEKPRLALTTLKTYLSLKRRQLFEETLTLESMMHDLTLHQDSMASFIEANYVKY